ncbi:TIGR02584 family CRISPR-associated protein [Microbulbifer flavimaris]|uniref:TIGR02584 family CRISPR-associated protein n=1 Tax=Microbulbifer flavimaris TaxID=1781068 RepID=A0ABX4I0M0_9GAMM|nr:MULTISPECIES: CRISPR-associated ring nuclease Csm6 [Microbulbifer]KUJ83447.1 hypothetical protein AVO43_06170 [Microbulbifer sp. ZGT114]PCO05603.1 TIGR02584 family CRISPR-associated protein [Microbulbifer flavimaris]
MQPKRYLVALSGMSPQVVTETLYGLLQREGEAFLPTEIHILTTAKGAERVHRALLDPILGHFHHFCRDYDLEDRLALAPQHIHVAQAEDGRPLSDIFSQHDNTAMADFICETVRRLSEDADIQLHASLAGGRKTMGFFLGYAMSLFGRPGDELSHVLVSEGFESRPDFFYPRPSDRLCGESTVEVMLADIPFVPMREELPKNFLTHKRSYSEAVQIIRAAEQPADLKVDMAGKRVRASGIDISMSNSLLAFYAWMVDRAKSAQGGLAYPFEHEPNRVYGLEFTRFYEAVSGGEMRVNDRTARDEVEGMDRRNFEVRLSRVNTALRNALGNRLAEKYTLKYIDTERGVKQYGVALAPEEIEIK